MNFIDSLGRATLSFFRQAREIFVLLGQTIYWVVMGPFRKKPVSSKNFFAQTIFAGLDSVAIVFFVDFFIGMVLAMQSAYQLQQMGATIYVAALVGVSMTREIGPVLTSLVTAWPSGRVTFASPKSSTFTCRRGVIMMLAGLMSRCVMPFVCASSKASATWRPISMTSPASSE